MSHHNQAWGSGSVNGWHKTIKAKFNLWWRKGSQLPRVTFRPEVLELEPLLAPNDLGLFSGTALLDGLGSEGPLANPVAQTVLAEESPAQPLDLSPRGLGSSLPTLAPPVSDQHQAEPPRSDGSAAREPSSQPTAPFGDNPFGDQPEQSIVIGLLSVGTNGLNESPGLTFGTVSTSAQPIGPHGHSSLSAGLTTSQGEQPEPLPGLFTGGLSGSDKISSPADNPAPLPDAPVPNPDQVLVKENSPPTTSGGQERYLEAPAAHDGFYETHVNTTLTEDAPGLLTDAYDADGDTLTVVLERDANYGDLTLYSDGSFTYEPGLNIIGTDTFEYKVFDGTDYSAPATVSIDITNNAPIVWDDECSLLQGTFLTVSAADGPLVSDFDPDHDPITATLVDGPSHGTLSFNSDGSFSYHPTPSFSGPDSFTYRVNDGFVDSEEVAEVRITVEARDRPIAIQDYYKAHIPFPGYMGIASSNVLANDYLPHPSPGSVQLVSGPSHAQSFGLNYDGTFNYSSTPGYTGLDYFQYRAYDGYNYSDPVTVTLKVTPPGAPFASPDYYYVRPMLSLSTSVPGVVANDVFPQSYTTWGVTVETAPVHAEAFTLNTDGSFTYQPVAGYFGLDTFQYRLTVGGSSAIGLVTILMPGMKPMGDMIIHNGLLGYSGGQAFDEDPVESEFTKGAVTVANLNDTDGDGTVDKDDNDVSVGAAPVPGRNEIDLMRLVLEQPQPAAMFPNGDVRVRIAAGDVKLYKNHITPTKEQCKCDGEAPATIPLTAFTNDSNNNNSKDIILWVEAQSASAMQGIELVYEFKPQGQENWEVLDKVRATAVWVTATRAFHTRGNAPDNPSVGPGGDIPELDEKELVDWINETYKSVLDGTRYGPGMHKGEGDPAKDARLGGRILWEFEVSPKKVETLGVVFDVTRQVETRRYDMIAGDAGPPVLTTKRDFPETQNPVKDNELPNDDREFKDEDNKPSPDGTPNVNPGRIYSFDAPAVNRNAVKNQLGEYFAFAIFRDTFREWVRIKLNNGRFGPGELVEGSRASAKEPWSHVTYSTLGEFTTANLERHYEKAHWKNGRNPDYNTPVLILDNGLPGTSDHGTAEVTILNDQLTDGYTARFDAVNQRWTLTEKSSNQSTSAGLVGDTWTLTLGTKVKVVITKGTPAFPFKGGDKFVFSVLREQGALFYNNIWRGAWDVKAAL